MIQINPYQERSIIEKKKRYIYLLKKPQIIINPLTSKISLVE